MSFHQVSNSEKDLIYQRIKESYPTSTICWIEKINNQMLEQRYTNHKKTSRANTELQLFHGTNEENIAPIMENGFDPTKNKRSAYGKGTYFARNAMISMGYVSGRDDILFMFLCDVLIDAETIIEESVGIYVSPNKSASIPRYVITFHKTADSLSNCIRQH